MPRSLPLLLILVGLTGCLAPKSFLEPKYGGIGYQDIQPPRQAQPVNLNVTGLSNGSEKDQASAYWRRQVVRVLTATRAFSFPDGISFPANLTIVINNVGNRGAAAGQGFVTGLTFGAVGSLVTDGYIMTVEYDRPGKAAFHKTYQHAIYTTIGNASPPPGIAPVTLLEAPSLVAEQMLLHFVKDLMAEGDLP